MAGANFQTMWQTKLVLVLVLVLVVEDGRHGIEDENENEDELLRRARFFNSAVKPR